MRMKMKKVDLKKFLVEKGERVGLYACLAVMGLMLVFGLFMPGRGLFSGSPAENERRLKEQSNQTRQRLIVPPQLESDKVAILESRKISGELLRSGEHPKADADYYRPGGHLFLADGSGDTKRRAPTILEPSGYHAAVAQAQVRIHVFDKNMSQIMVLRGAPSTAAQTAANKQAANSLRHLGKQGTYNPGLYKRPDGPQIPSRSPTIPGGEGAEPPRSKEDPFGDKQHTPKSEFVDLDKFEMLKDARLAEDILPLRMGVIVGQFPLRRQIENFKRALRLSRIDQVFTSRGDNVPQFQFLGLQVDRRTVGADGKTTEWAPLDVIGDYRPVVGRTGRRFEPEDPKLRPVIFDGLVMPRPLQFRDGQYPAVENQLTGIKSTLEELDKQAQDGVKTVKPRSPFDASDFNPFSGAADEVPPPEGAGRTGTEGEVNPTGQTSTQPEWTPPEFCLLRFIDVTIKPGKVYEYRVRVRMANPNYGRISDVISKNLAEGKDLVSDSFVVKDEKGEPIRLAVPPDAHFYVTEGRSTATGVNQQLALQAHRWIDLVAPNPKNQSTTFAVADWVVADPVLVNRGEYLRRADEKSAPRTNVPIWVSERESFVLATDPSLGSVDDKTRIVVPFSPANGEMLLVDFQGGQVTHSKLMGTSDDKPNYVTIKDRAPVEMLYLSPDGKLLARDSETDKRDKERLDRVEHFKKRVGEAKEKKDTKEPKKPMGT